MGLVEHAEREMKLAGLDTSDSDYGGMLYDAVMKLVKVHAEEGHSGGSHAMTMKIFNQVANFKRLSPLGSTPDEWMQVAENQRPGTEDLWQNKRQSSVFSRDGGKTWYDIDNPSENHGDTWGYEPKPSLFGHVIAYFRSIGKRR